MLLENEYKRVDSWIMQAVLSIMEEGVMVLDRNAYIVMANPAAYSIFLAREGQLLYRKPEDVIACEEVVKLIYEAINTGREFFKEILMVPPSQVYRVHAAPIKDLIDSSQGVVVLFNDVTEAKDFAQIRSEFVGNVSHELRTPLTSIKGFVETLLDGAMENGAICRRFLHIIEAETERLSHIIEDLLALSAIESKEKEINRKPVCVIRSMKNVLNILGPQISEKNVRVEFTYPRNLPYVNADEDLLGQVLINLLDNAIKYTAEKGKIVIRSEQQDSRVITTFTDTGMGISEDSLPRVFERFYRVDKARSRSKGGSGLGLSIVKHIVEAHGGEVFVDSQMGKGSTFGVSFLII